MKNTLKIISGVALLSFASQSFAAICTSEGRTAELTISTVCESGNGNPHTNDINNLYGDTPSWEKVSDIAGFEGTDLSLADGPLRIGLNTGSLWGSTDVTGIWGIHSSFWSQFDEAVISMHVGGNPQDNTSDFFA
jgi:hypothetical protein